LAVLNYLPTITGADGTFQFLRPFSQNFIENTARSDQQLTKKDRLTLRYFYDSFTNASVLNNADLVTCRFHGDSLSQRINRRTPILQASCSITSNSAAGLKMLSVVYC
jgi:hypothetical protein